MKYSQINPTGEKIFGDCPISVHSSDIQLKSLGHSVPTALLTCKKTLGSPKRPVNSVVIGRNG